jgi:hypothetical protein
MKRLLLIGCLLALTPLAFADEGASELERLREENAALRARIAELEDKIERLENRGQDLEAEKQQLEQLAGVTTSGQKIESKRALIQSQFNQDAGRTVVRSKPEKLSITHGSRADHYLSLAYSYPGENIESEPEHVTVFIQSLMSGGDYSATTPLELTLDDGEKLSIKPSDYERVRKQTRTGQKGGSRTDNETLTYELSWEQLRRLARAVEATGRIGNTRFELTGDQLATFKAIRERVGLGL